MIKPFQEEFLSFPAPWLYRGVFSLPLSQGLHGMCYMRYGSRLILFGQ